MKLPVSTADRIPFRPVDKTLDSLSRALERAETDRERTRLNKAIAELEPKRENQPVYYLKVATLFERAACRRDITASGADYPGLTALYSALRADLSAASPYNLEELLALIDEREEAVESEVDPEAFAGLEAIARIARTMGGQFAALEGDRRYWLDVAPIIACQHFLVGWENVTGKDGQPAKFERRGGRTTDASLEQLEEGDLRAVGYEIIGAWRPAKDVEKNSESPSPSTSDPSLSRQETTLLTDQSGSSSASATGETPAVS